MKKNLILLVIMVALVLSACGGNNTDLTSPEVAAGSTEKPTESTEKPADAQDLPEKDEFVQSEVIRMPTAGDYGLPNPYRHAGRGPGIFKMQMLYDSLLEKGKEGDIPWLAKSWDESDDGLEVTFNLVENAFWHDGEALDADDVLFTFGYIEKHLPGRVFTMDRGESIIDSIEKTGDFTVKIRFKRYSPIYISSVGSVRILPEHIWSKVDDPKSYDGEGKTVGSGPYVLDNYTADQGLYRFTAFDKYWGKRPVTKAIEYIPVSNQVLALENGEIDFGSVSPETKDRFEGKEDMKVVSFNTHHAYRLYLNQEIIPEFKERSVRQAVAYALDRKGYVEKIQRGYGEPAPMGYLHSEHRFYNPNIEKYDYNLEKAKELMAGRKINVTMLLSNSPKELRLAELIKIDLEKIGINVELKSMERRARDGVVKKNDYETALIYYGGLGSDPDVLRRTFSTYKADGKGGSVPGYSNQQLDEILNQQAQEKDPEKRMKLVHESQKIIAEDVPMVMVYADYQICAYNSKANDSWTSVYDHSRIQHPKISFLEK